MIKLFILRNNISSFFRSENVSGLIGYLIIICKQHSQDPCIDVVFLNTKAEWRQLWPILINCLKYNFSSTCIDRIERIFEYFLDLVEEQWLNATVSIPRTDSTREVSCCCSDLSFSTPLNDSLTTDILLPTTKLSFVTTMMLESVFLDSCHLQMVFVAYLNFSMCVKFLSRVHIMY